MNEEEKFEEAIQQKFYQTSKIHWNLESVFIITTEDKLRLCLHKNIDRLDVKRKWWTPLALFVSLLLALTTAEFKEQFTIPAATWLAIFLIAAAVSLIWTVMAIWKAKGVKVSVESIVSEIKQPPTEDKKNTELSRFTEFQKKLFRKKQ